MAQVARTPSNPYWTYYEDAVINGNPAALPLDWEQQERTQFAPPAPAGGEPPCPAVGTSPDGY
jgi:hypothetical protein